MKPLLSLPFLALLGLSYVSQDEAPPPVRLGTGDHVYTWVTDWAQLPAGTALGNTHGCIVTDAKDRVYVNTDTENAVFVFSPDGELLATWGEELAGGLHGMTLVEEPGEPGQPAQEFLYLAHHARHEVLKTTLEGEVLWTLGVPTESGLYDDPNTYRPTSVAVAPDGRLFVADGYGRSWIHEYDAERNWVRAHGGPGTEAGQLRTPHGIWMDGTELMIADRENGRIQTFDLDGTPLSLFDQELRRPCHVHPTEDAIAVPDLAGRVTILDREGKLICHLGDNPDPAKRARNDVPVEEWRNGEFLSPHCARWDSRGNLYVMDWNARGRITKLARVR